MNECFVRVGIICTHIMRHHHHHGKTSILHKSEPWEWRSLGVADPVNSGLPPIKEERKCERGEIAIFFRKTDVEDARVRI